MKKDLEDFESPCAETKLNIFHNIRSTLFFNLSLGGVGDSLDLFRPPEAGDSFASGSGGGGGSFASNRAERRTFLKGFPWCSWMKDVKDLKAE